jgi:hypothetical protein
VFFWGTFGVPPLKSLYLEQKSGFFGFFVFFVVFLKKGSILNGDQKHVDFEAKSGHF